MAYEKAAEPQVVTLVAVERGFIGGALIEPGKSFAFDLLGADGKPRKLPKWAVKEGDPRLSRPKPKVGDLKPQEAQAAAKVKAGALADGAV